MNVILFNLMPPFIYNSKKNIRSCKTYYFFRITFVKVLEVFMERVEFVT